MLFDSHAHYDDKQFDADRDEILSSMRENNVGLIMNACSALEDIPVIENLCEKYDFIYGAAGVHPSDCAGLMESDMEIIKKACTKEKIKAVGEIGLDYFYDEPERSIQKKWFARQIELAVELGMPVIVHDREAHFDTIDLLKHSGDGKVTGVLHCFSGSREMAKEVLDMGMYIAFGGTLTFKNARRAVEAAEYVPLDRILLETDSPYLAPVPVRGKRNSSLYIHYVAEKLAEIKGLSVLEVEDATFENAKRCFGID